MSPSIWVVNHYANPSALPGNTRHFELARRLEERGWDVTLIASSFHHGSRTLLRPGIRKPSAELVDGVRFVWIPSRCGYVGNDISRVANMTEFAWRVWRSGWSSFDRNAPRPDVVVGSSPHLLAPLVAWRLARRFGAPLVLEVRDLWPETLVALGAFGRYHPTVIGLQMLERFLYRHADRIISLLPEAWRYIEGPGVPRGKIDWIPNGATIPPEIPHPLAGPVDGPFTVMYAGAHGRANMLDDLLSAAAVAQVNGAEMRFVLIGDGPEKERLIKRAEHESLTNVEFRTAVPKTVMPAILAEADAVVALLEDTPLYRYGISLNKLFDYMAAGKPIVLAGNVAHNYIEIAQCGLTVPPRDPEGLVGALVKLAEMSSDARREMGLRGRAYVEVHHDWDLLADRLADVLDEVVAGPRSGAR